MQHSEHLPHDQSSETGSDGISYGPYADFEENGEEKRQRPDKVQEAIVRLQQLAEACKARCETEQVKVRGDIMARFMKSADNLLRLYGLGENPEARQIVSEHAGRLEVLIAPIFAREVQNAAMDIDEQLPVAMEADKETEAPKPLSLIKRMGQQALVYQRGNAWYENRPHQIEENCIDNLNGRVWNQARARVTVGLESLSSELRRTVAVSERRPEPSEDEVWARNWLNGLDINPRDKSLEAIRRVKSLLRQVHSDSAESNKLPSELTTERRAAATQLLTALLAHRNKR